MITLVLVLHVVVTMLMVYCILISRGGDSSLGSSGRSWSDILTVQAPDFLTKMIVILVGLFFITTVVLIILFRGKSILLTGNYLSFECLYRDIANSDTLSLAGIVHSRGLTI